MDKQVSRLLDELRARELADDDTQVIITGDLWRGIGVDSWVCTFQAHQEDVNVPLVIWSPDCLRLGGRVNTIDGHVDLSATVLDLLGSRSRRRGRELVAPDRPPRAYKWGKANSVVCAVREKNWKYVVDWPGGRLG